MWEYKPDALLISKFYKSTYKSLQNFQKSKEVTFV